MSIPTAPQSIADCVRINYNALVHFSGDFRSALVLLGWLHDGVADRFKRSQLFGWGTMARNHAALSVFHFGNSLLAIRTYAGRVAEPQGAIDANELRLAWKRYSHAFPHVENVRHAIAHAGELNSTPERTVAHAVSRGTTVAYMVEGGKLIGEARLRIGLNGQWFELDIGETTAQFLEQIISQVGRALPSSLKDGAPP